MTSRNLWLVLIALGLGAVYAIWFTDWFHPQTVRIFSSSRNAGNRRRPSPMMFFVNHPTRFSELKVVSLADYATNKSVLPIWHLISDSNSVAVKNFYYGQNIGGMHPALKGIRPEPLESNIMYRMFVTAGKIKGQHDFELK